MKELAYPILLSVAVASLVFTTYLRGRTQGYREAKTDAARLAGASVGLELAEARLDSEQRYRNFLQGRSDMLDYAQRDNENMRTILAAVMHRLDPEAREAIEQYSRDKDADRLRAACGTSPNPFDLSKQKGVTFPATAPAR